MKIDNAVVSKVSSVEGHLQMPHEKLPLPRELFCVPFLYTQIELFMLQRAQMFRFLPH